MKSYTISVDDKEKNEKSYESADYILNLKHTNELENRNAGET